METPFVPVTVQCKTCKRKFVEWFSIIDTVGKTKHWAPKLDCDECFCNRCIPMYREMVRNQFAKRSQQMFERFPYANLGFLDAVHQAMFKRKLAGLSSGTIDDTFSHKNRSIVNKD